MKIHGTNDRNTVTEEIGWLDVILVEFEMKARNAIRSILKVWIYKTKVQGMVRSQMQIWKLLKKTVDTKIETTKMLMS